MNLTFKQFLTEKADFESLKKNKVPLTDQEREQCLKAEATWNSHPDPSKNPIPAVWKSKNKNGDVTYITNTHRAWRSAPTLKGAIRHYHDFIKGTA